MLHQQKEVALAVASFCCRSVRGTRVWKLAFKAEDVGILPSGQNPWWAALAVVSLLLVEPLQSSTLLRVAQKVLPLAVSFLIIVPLLLYLYSDMLVRQDTASGMRIPRPKIWKLAFKAEDVGILPFGQNPWWSTPKSQNWTLAVWFWLFFFGIFWTATPELINGK